MSKVKEIKVKEKRNPIYYQDYLKTKAAKLGMKISKLVSELGFEEPAQNVIAQELQRLTWLIG